MDISLDNPGFQVDVADVEIHQVDVPKSSSGSSSSGDSTRRSCTKCHGRMSSFSLDRHLFCTKCRGSECTVNSRYPISTLPEHLHSTILRTPKLPENTHKPKETRFLPSLMLVPLLANHPLPLLTPFTGSLTPTHPF